MLPFSIIPFHFIAAFWYRSQECRISILKNTMQFSKMIFYSIEGGAPGLPTRVPDAVKFLQGLLTNDVCRLAAQDIPAGGSDSQTPYVPTQNLNHRNPPPLYAALVTPQGRFLYARPLPLSPPGANEKLNWSGSGPGSDELLDAAVVDELLH
ncbi:transferase, mitochondrial [Canna indica]|uniref:Transferase, mitochondrial n=1 Tax=Canna indica TaxID=4628 RepID=A0AAQ3KZ65_9LILI|nr:transferase, mitochondrial [Canna indica]